MIKVLPFINRHEFSHFDKSITKCLNKHGHQERLLPVISPLINTLIHSVKDERSNSIYLTAYLSIYIFVRPSGFTNEHILDTLYVQTVFVWYIFIVLYTLLDIGFDDKDY